MAIIGEGGMGSSRRPATKGPASGGLFGQSEWAVLAEYRRGRGVRPTPREASPALSGYRPMPAGHKAAALGNALGNALGAFARMGRKSFRDPANLAARTQSAREVLNTPVVGPDLIPHADPDKIQSLFRSAGRRFWGEQGWNTTIPNTLENRTSTFYAGTPHEGLMRTAIGRAQAGRLAGTNSAASAETEALRKLTGDPSLGLRPPHPPMSAGNVPTPSGGWAPREIVVPRTKYRAIEGTGLAAGGAALGGLGYAGYRAAGGGQPPASDPRALAAGAGAVAGGGGMPAPVAAGPGQDAAAGAVAGGAAGGAAVPPPSRPLRLADVLAGAAAHVGQHRREYGLGAAGLAGVGGLLWLRHLRERRRQAEQERLQRQFLSKTGSCAAAGVLAYCGDRGYGEAEIRHVVVKAAEAVPGLADEFATLFASAGELVKAGFGIPDAPSSPSSPAPAGPGPAPASPKVPATPAPAGPVPRARAPTALPPRPTPQDEVAHYRTLAQQRGQFPDSYTTVGGRRYAVGDIGPDRRRFLGVRQRESWLPGFLGGGRTTEPVWDEPIPEDLAEQSRFRAVPWRTVRPRDMTPEQARGFQVQRDSNWSQGAIRATTPGVPSWGGGLLQAAGRAAGGILPMATGVASLPGTAVVSGGRLLRGDDDPMAPVLASARDVFRPVENAYGQPVEALASRLMSPLTGAGEDAHQLAAASARPGITDEFRAAAGREYDKGLDPGTGSAARFAHNQAGNFLNAAPTVMSFLGLAGPTAGLAHRAAVGLTRAGIGLGGRAGATLANTGLNLAGRGPGLAALGEGLAIGGTAAVSAYNDPNLHGRGQEVAEQAQAERRQMEDLKAGRIPAQQVPNLHPDTLRAIPAEHAPLLFEDAQRGLYNYTRALQASGGKVDPARGTPELEGALRSLIAARVVGGGLREDPEALFRRIAADGVSPDELRQVQDLPGNEPIAGGPDVPPEEKQQRIMSFFGNPQVPGLFKGLVGIGVPVAILGLLSSVLGHGGLGGVLMAALGLGAAAYGAHRGGLLQGTGAAGMMDSVFGPAPAGPDAAPSGGGGEAGGVPSPAPRAAVGQGPALGAAQRQAFMAAPAAARGVLLREYLRGHPEHADAFRTAHGMWNSGFPGTQTMTAALARNRLGMPDLTDREIQAYMDAYGGR